MFDIGYVKLNFKIRFRKGGILPKYKMSALRGGIGHVLLKRFCTQSKGDCNSCLTREGCLVNEILTPRIETNLPFLKNVKTSNSGFILECENFKTVFREDDEITFTLILFNKSCRYIGHFIYAFDKLGEIGIGKDKIKYDLINVVNDDEEVVFEDGCLFKENISTKLLSEYIEKRKCQLKNIEKIEIIIPLRILRNGKLIDDLNYKDLLFSMIRRIMLLNALEGKEVNFNAENIDNFIKSKNLYWTENERYSNRQKSKMSLGGVSGEIYFTDDIKEIEDLLIACELIHIGKNTTFGLGKYVIKEG